MLKWCFITFAFLALCHAQAPASSQSRPDGNSQKGKIEGRVTGSTGEPLRKVTLRLASVVTVSNGQLTSRPLTYSAESDAQGDFVIDEVEPGRYTLRAERTGFVQAGAAVTVNSGQYLTGISLKMTPQAVIAGRITDEDGDPFPNAQVSALRWTYMEGRKQLQIAGTAAAGPDGAFAIGNLPPGPYYIKAVDSRTTQPGVQVATPGHKGPEEEYVATYYPGVNANSAAVPIHLTAGADLRGIQFPMNKSRVFRIRGTASNTPTSSGIALSILPKDLVEVLGNRTFPIFQNGVFEFGHLQPGTYIIQTLPSFARPGEDAAQSAHAREVVTVGDEDVDNVVLRLGPSVEVTGKITNADQNGPKAASTAPIELPRINLSTIEALPVGNLAAQSKDNGTFVIHGVAPGLYQISVTGLVSGTYVKSIRFGDVDVTHAALDLTSGGGAVEIVLSSNAAEASGVVHNSDGKALSSIWVSLWTPGNPPDGTWGFSRSMVTDANGAFDFSGIPPGAYRVAAWEQIDAGVTTNPEFRAKFDSQAAKVTLSESSRETVEPVLIGHQAIESAVATLR